jgi:hypothetical protein
MPFISDSFGSITQSLYTKVRTVEKPEETSVWDLSTVNCPENGFKIILDKDEGIGR